MTPPVTTQDMLPSEATFLAAMQQLGFGRFEYLQIRGGELVLDPWPATVRDVKFATPPNAGKPSEPNSALVSPIARPMPSMTAVRIPDRAAGTTTRQMVCQRVAPIASPASR